IVISSSTPASGRRRPLVRPGCGSQSAGGQPRPAAADDRALADDRLAAEEEGLPVEVDRRTYMLRDEPEEVAEGGRREAADVDRQVLLRRRSREELGPADDLAGRRPAVGGVALRP